MKYNDSELIEKLAAEYVLGTLHGNARLRFESLMDESFQVRAAVWQWEAQINPLVSALPQEKPPKRVWQNIKRATSPQTQQKMFNGLRFWRGWGVVATLGIVLLTVSFLQLPKGFQPNYMAVFNNEQAKPMWIVTSDLESGALQIKAVNVEAKDVDKQAYELWMLPSDGSPPKSMGLMPVTDKKREFVLSPQILKVLQKAKGLAISIEPPGGSPTGLPTGPVVYQSEMIAL